MTGQKKSYRILRHFKDRRKHKKIYRDFIAHDADDIKLAIVCAVQNHTEAIETGFALPPRTVEDEVISVTALLQPGIIELPYQFSVERYLTDAIAAYFAVYLREWIFKDISIIQVGKIADQVEYRILTTFSQVRATSRTTPE